MTDTDTKISPKTLAIVAALVVPLLLIPGSSNAKSPYAEWQYLDHRLKVKLDNQGRQSRKSDRRALDRFFDQPAPQKSKALSRARNKQLNRSKKRRANRAGRRNHLDYYEDDYGISCLSPRQIHRQLKRQGWRKFHNLRIRPTVLRFKARQRNGLTYHLKIDRCSGSLIKARLQLQDMWYLRWLRRISTAF